MRDSKPVLIIMSVCLAVAIIGVGYYITQPQIDYICGTDTCYYYNLSKYTNDYCNQNYGADNWKLIPTKDSGLGGMYYLPSYSFNLQACVKKSGEVIKT